MFQIADGRECFWQWDLNRQIVVNDPDITEVHFCNKTDDCSLVVEVNEVAADTLDGQHFSYRTANVPNILLQNDFPIRVYAYCRDGYTKIEKTFKVVSRTRPSDYVYTETEVRRFSDLEDRVEAIEQNGVPEGRLEEAVEREINSFSEVMQAYSDDAANKAKAEAIADAVNEATDNAITYTDNKASELLAEMQELEDKTTEAHNKAIEVNTLANNALNIADNAFDFVQIEQERAKEAENAINVRVDANEDALDKLNGTGEGSITKAVADALAELVANAPESLNTLKEIADWIASHAGDAAAMNSGIRQNAEDIDALEKLLGTLPEGVASTTVIEYIREVAKAEDNALAETLRGEIAQAVANIDLTDYVKNTDYATDEKAGVVKAGSNQYFDGIYITEDGHLELGNDTDLIAQRVSGLPIRNQDLDYAVKEGVTNNDETLTDEEKTKACSWLGAVRPTDYATNTVGGTVKVSDGDTGAPLYRNVSGILRLGNYNHIIDAKTSENAVRNKDIDYAVMKALTDPIQHEWTGEEQEKAQTTLGISPIKQGLEQLQQDFQTHLYSYAEVDGKVNELTPRIDTMESIVTKITYGEWNSNFYVDGVSDVEVRMLSIEGYGVYEYFYLITKSGYSKTGGGMIYCAAETVSNNLNYGCRYSDEYIEVYDGNTEGCASAYILVKAGDYSNYNIVFKMRKIREV